METLKFGITRYWWIPMLTGVIALGLGIWCLCSPVTSVPVMAYIFAALICIAGIFNLAFAAFNHRIAPNWGWSLALGLLDLVAGIWMLTLPEEEPCADVCHRARHLAYLRGNKRDMRDVCA